MYVLYQSIAPSKYSLFPRGCHCWKNRLKRWILPILLLFVVLSINLLNIHHWKRTALWRGKSVSNWMTEICPDSHFINLILWCSLAGWKSSTNVFPKGQLKKLYLLLWVCSCCSNCSFIWVHLFCPAELINVHLVRSKWPQICLMNGLLQQSSPWKRLLLLVWKSP